MSADFETGSLPLTHKDFKLALPERAEGVEVDLFFGRDLPRVGCWQSLYQSPVDKRAGDLQWRTVHEALATNRYLVHLDLSTGDGCPFCSQ